MVGGNGKITYYYWLIICYDYRDNDNFYNDRFLNVIKFYIIINWWLSIVFILNLNNKWLYFIYYLLLILSELIC